MRWIIICILFFTVSEGFTQYSEWVATDRPCQTMNPASIGKKVIQMQTGYTNGRTINQANTAYNTLDTKIRIGVLERGDVSFSMLGGWYPEFENAGSSEGRIDLYTVNARYFIYRGEGAAPSVGAEMGAAFPAMNEYGLEEDVDLRAVLSLSSAVSEKFAITGNIITNSTDNFEFTLNFAYAFSERLGAMAEYWSIFGTSFDDNKGHYLNVGGYYNLSKNFQLDIASLYMFDYGPWAESADFHDFQFQFGFTGRIDWRK